MTLDAGSRADDADVLSAAALDAIRGAVQVRASADAVEVQAVATLTLTRRRQALRADPAAELDLVDTGTAAEIALLRRLAPGTARSAMELALRFTGDAHGTPGTDDGEPNGHGPATFAALRRGALDLARARRLTEQLSQVPLPEVDEARARELGVEVPADASSTQRRDLLRRAARRLLVQALVLVEAELLEPGSVPALADRRPGPAAGDLTPTQLDARLRRLVARALPAAHEQRLREAHERRSCTLRHLGGADEGTALLQVTGRADLLHAAFTRLDGTARALLAADRAAAVEPTVEADTRRTVDQARVDTLLAMVLGDSESLAAAHRVRVELALVAPAGAVLPGGTPTARGPEGDGTVTLGAGVPARGDAPGELDGVGPVPASLVRELAADARWRRWVTDPETGLVTWTSPRTYRPTAAVARLVKARDRECTFPTCRARARSDVDHVIPFPEGPTVPENLCVTCRRHHRLKHHGSFRTRLEPDGTLTWTTPTGVTVRNPTPSHPPPAVHPPASAEPPPF
ncbi:HNH endonuclease signature motif containing protein [Aquipuribacter sp. SD81]|uniref:HNH endonuclease signature motif containing protein n=1 Tax=Aquipuribacter sp. SD81 TaxID=3127703 RepID=UPI003017B3F4